MSRESLEWLNTNTLVGFTEQRGKAWHYRASEQGDRTNHFPGAVPLERVKELFAWKPVEMQVFGIIPAVRPFMDEHGVHPGSPARLVRFPERKAVVRSDYRDAKGVEIASLNSIPWQDEKLDLSAMGMFKEGYEPHDYTEWLVENVAHLLDDKLSIGSAGLLRDGAQAWVSVEVPDTITTREGVAYRPHLLAVTSFDGWLSTTYKDIVTNVVCDNTMYAGLSESGKGHKTKHSKNSKLRIADARDALNMVFKTSENFERYVKELCETEVSEKAWRKFLDLVTPIPAEKGRSRTMAEKKYYALSAMWTTDPRVSTWKGTGWGVVQAVNTYTHHAERVVKAHHRAERNMGKAVRGDFNALDVETIATMHKALALV